MEKELNLIQQLQITPKWNEFYNWFVYSNIGLEVDFYTFIKYPFMLQKGVFEKFIKDEGDVFNPCDLYVWSSNNIHHADTFEELLIWYFNS